MAKIEFGVGFKLDKSGLSQAKSEIQQISKMLESGTNLKIDSGSLSKLKSDLLEVDKALDRAFDKDLGKLNISKLTSDLRKAKVNVDDLARTFSTMGVSGANFFKGIQNEALRTGVEIKKTKGFVEDMADTLTKTVKWGIASSAVNSFSGAIQRAAGYVKGMDQSLTDIRIVTGKSADEMAVFKDEANEAAKALGKTTKEYSDASLIFFQQGKSAAEVKELTQATLIGAGITGTEVTDMADYLTAVMNGYVLEANKAMEVTDKLAAVGAATGADFAELAIGMSKVASAANVMGVPLDNLNAMLATVTTVTREAPETIGTTFKTIFARMSELQAGGEDEEGWTTGKVEEALNMIDVSIIDQTTGKMKDMGAVMNEVGEKWETLNRESQVGVAVAMAGQRQSSRLIALFENWNMYTDAVETSESAVGAAMEQNLVRMDSLEFKSKQLRAEIEDVWNSLINEQMFAEFYDGMIGIVQTIGGVVDGFGGLENILLTLGGVAANVFSKQIARGLMDLSKNVNTAFEKVREVAEGTKEMTWFEKGAISSVNEDAERGEISSDIQGVELDLINKKIDLRKQEERIVANLSEEDAKRYQGIKDQLLAEEEKLAILKKQRIEAAEEAKSRLTEEETGRLEEDPVALEEEIRSKIQEQTEEHDKLYLQQQALNKLVQEEGFSYDDIETLLLSNNKELGNKQRILKGILKEYGLTAETADDLVDTEGNHIDIVEKVLSIYQEVGESVESINDVLNETEQTLEDIVTIQNSGAATVEENAAEANAERLRREAEAYDQQAQKVEKVQVGIEALGVAMQGISAIKIFAQLGDEALTAEEKTNILTSGLGALSGVFLSLVPVLGSLATAFGLTWAAALGPIAAIIGGVAAVGVAIVKVVDYFNPFTRAVKKNNEVLEEQNKLLSEAKTRLNDLRGSQSAFAELQKEMFAGTDESGNALYASIGDLDTEQYEKYVELSNQVATVAPQLVKYYDEMGNAIVDLTGDYEGLMKQEEENIRVSNAARAANRENFAIEYERNLQEAEAQIESKRRIIKGLSESSTGYYYGYSADDIDTLTSEITKLQGEIQDTQGKIYTNIIDPIFSGSKAYTELTEKNQDYARGLVDTQRISEKLNDPEKLERYVGIVETFIGEMTEQNAELVKGIADTEAQMASLEEGGVSEEEVAQYTQLKEQLKELKATTVEVSESFNGLSDVQRQNALEIASIFEVQEGNLDSLLSKIVETTISTEGLTQMLSTGMMPDAGALMSAAGYEAPVQESPEVLTEEGGSKAASIREEIAAMNEQVVAYQNLLSQQRETGVAMEEQLATSQLLKEAKQSLNEVESELTSVNEQNLMLAIERDTYEREQAQLQEQLNEQMWANVDALLETTDGYNQLAEAYNTSIEQIGNMTEEVEKLDEIMRESSVVEGEGPNFDEIAESLENYADKIPGLGDALAEMADNGEAGFEKVRNVINEVADQQGKLYAKMRGQDQAYWTEFQSKNRNQTSLIEYEYGIRASDYENYQEYEKAVAKLSEKDKIRYMDDATRDKIMLMNEEELAAWEVANNQAMYSYESYRQQAENGHESAKSQGLSFSQLKNAGLTTTQSLAIMAAQVLDGVLNSSSGMINAVINGINFGIRAVNKFMTGVVNTWNSFVDLINKIPGVDIGHGTAWQIDEIEAFTGSNLTESLYDKFQESNKSDQPDFDFNYGGSNTGIDKKPGGTTPSGDRFQDDEDGPGTGGPGAGSGGSGGDKGGSDSGGKEVEDLEWEEDIYHDINIQLEQKQQLLDKLQKQQDKLYGKELLDNLAKQKQALIEQQKLLEKKLEMQKQDLANQQKALSSQGVQFNVDGTIANYNQLLAQKLAYVNSLSGEAKEAAKEEFSSLVEMMEAYEEMMMNTIVETENAIQDSIDAQREIFLQEFEYEINIQLELSEDFQDALQFLKDMSEGFESGGGDYELTTQQLVGKMGEVKDIQAQIEKINADTSLTDKERIEMLDEQSKLLKEALKDAKGLEEELTKIFIDTLKEGIELNKEFLDGYKGINDELKFLEQTLKLIGEGDNYEVLDQIYEEQYDSMMGQINLLNKQNDVLKEQRAQLEAAGMKGTDEWKAINDAILDTQDSLNSLATESLKLLQTEFKNSVDEIMASLENAMTGDMGFDELKKQQKELKEERKKYLDGEEKLIEINKLQKKLQKEIESTTDPAKKAQLQKFMDTELKNLKEKDKLTKYDVDRANLVYDLTLKQMALEEQRAAKNTMRLVRDTQGNWVYEFTEDAAAVEKAQNDVSDALEKLMQLDKKRLEESQDEMLKLQEEYYKEVQKITQDALNGKYKTEEEYQAALEAATEKYNEKMLVAQEDYEQAKQNATISSLAVILDSYRTTGNELEGLTDEQQEAMRKLAEAVEGDYLGLQGAMDAILNGDEDSIKKAFEDLGITSEGEIAGITSALDTAITNMKDGWQLGLSDMISDMIGGKDGNGGFQEASKNAIQSIMNKWSEYQDKVGNVKNTTGTNLDDIKNRIEGADKATEGLNSETQALIDRFKNGLSAVTSWTTAFQSQRLEIQGLIKDMTDYIKKLDEAIAKKKEEATGVKPGTGNTGAGSSGGTTSPPPAPTPPPAPPKPTGPQGNGVIDKGDRVKVKSANASAWYTSTGTQVADWSAQARAVGKNWNDDFYVYNQANNRVALSKSAGEMALAWVDKNSITGFDTGGYTGAWGNEGKMAMLHEKEIVLNKQDTRNILDAVKLMRESGIADLMRRFGGAMSSITGAFSGGGYEGNNQNITINADFSGVKNSNEIEKAFENMSNMASQYAYRK